MAVLWDSSGIHEGSSLEQQRAAARELSLTLLPFDAKTLDELIAALATIKRERADGLFVFPNFINGKHFKLILDFQRPWASRSAPEPRQPRDRNVGAQATFLAPVAGPSPVGP